MNLVPRRSATNAGYHVDMVMNNPPDHTELRARLVAETGKIRWQELQTHFARGALIHVAPDLDLIDVAMHLVRDDKAAFERWLCAGEVARVTELHARRWQRQPPMFWAVVVAPWVLVQEVQQPTSLN